MTQSGTEGGVRSLASLPSPKGLPLLGNAMPPQGASTIRVFALASALAGLNHHALRWPAAHSRA